MKDVIVTQRAEVMADINEDKITTIMSVKKNVWKSDFSCDALCKGNSMGGFLTIKKIRIKRKLEKRCVQISGRII